MRALQQAANLAALGLMAFSLSACVVAVGNDAWDGDDDHHHRGRGTTVSVDIDDDRRVDFACPRGYKVFTKSDEDGAEEYGCRRDDGFAEN